jgi:hypothetical protein
VREGLTRSGRCGGRGPRSEGAEHGSVHEGAQEEPYGEDRDRRHVGRPVDLGAGVEREEHAQEGERGAVSSRGLPAKALSGKSNMAVKETVNTAR